MGSLNAVMKPRFIDPVEWPHDVAWIGDKANQRRRTENEIVEILIRYGHLEDLPSREKAKLEKAGLKDLRQLSAVWGHPKLLIEQHRVKHLSKYLDQCGCSNDPSFRRIVIEYAKELAALNFLLF